MLGSQSTVPDYVVVVYTRGHVLDVVHPDVGVVRENVSGCPLKS
jgi:hypothetical protein